MSLLLLLPVILSFLLLGAHFFRDGGLVLVGICLAMPLLLLVRRRWAMRIVQGALLLGALEWLATTVRLVEQRQEEGRPWIRMAVILGSVMVFTAASGLVFAAARLRRRYPARA